MSTTNPIIPAGTARHVLWRYDRRGGAEPGSFTKHLMAAIDAADVTNRAILRTAYPALSEALHLARYDEEGLAKLHRIATGQAPLACPCGDTAGPFTRDGRCETCAKAAA
ncbi:hypothetical protein [Streptomyces spectabilis]|uniref:Uncharacterized protein n=1 Tax=Streptomyces spectabilis TaxID=68270 RepID=A0A5P2X0S9_STRST|nr:hypothetical protein [Streptomyces spectabilis]MBB5108382.1 hypothetical protein [Streptomyces spectabilis]MCI3901137.1 hypothetical protein [Streptomyces spectabilis]QEV58627.1 hypothetical protein CP982_07755 [Streptomyces spectabilis]GGV46196.1 hypothetical protein GCM10010245_72440 [Streptomyces spectabilis]